MQRDDSEVETRDSHSLHPHLWVSRYADYLYAYAITRIGNEEQARDLVQETFLSALEGMDKFEGRSAEKTWLTAILKFKVIDLYRKRSSGLAKENTTQINELEQPQFFDPQDGHWNTNHRPKEFGIEQPDVLEKNEFQGILQQCLKRLPALWLSVFTMKHLDEESTEVICKELHVSPANFWVIIHRAKVTLRSCLQKNWN
jgi:RNA polymerase sigma-70 factor (ECF subfamily)